MSWAEVKKINSNLNIPLNEFLSTLGITESFTLQGYSSSSFYETTKTFEVNGRGALLYFNCNSYSGSFSGYSDANKGEIKYTSTGTYTIEIDDNPVKTITTIANSKSSYTTDYQSYHYSALYTTYSVDALDILAGVKKGSEVPSTGSVLPNNVLENITISNSGDSKQEKKYLINVLPFSSKFKMTGRNTRSGSGGQGYYTLDPNGYSEFSVRVILY